MGEARHFKTRADYLAWNRYGHYSHVFENTPGNTTVYVGGRKIKINHG